MLKVSVSGIRGIWGKSLTHEVLTGYAKSFVAFLGKNKKIAIGTDTRPTRDIIKKITLGVMESYGYEIIDLGILPTPLILFVVKELNLDGGVVISSSHNPIEWNAYKLVKKGGFFLNQQEMDQISEIYNNQSFLSYDFKSLGKTTPSHISVVKEYIEKAEKIVNMSLIRQAGFKVVVDGVNGTINEVIYPFLHFVDIKPQILFSDINQNFQRGPEPLPENLKALSEAVVHSKADIGLAYDPDADRLALVDEKGHPVGEDWTLAIAYLNYLEKEKTDAVVNLSTSMIMEEIAKASGQQIHYAKVGEINVTEMMVKKNLLFGGEGNGGVICRQINNCRDSLIATLMVLEYLAKHKKKLSEVIADFHPIHIIKTKIPVSETLSLEEIVSKLKQFLDRKKIGPIDVNNDDGVRMNFPDGWIQARASNTEPIIRIMGENTNSKFHKEITEYIQNEFRGNE